MNRMARIDGDTAVPTVARRPWGKWAVMLAVPLALLLIGGWFWLTSGRTVSTDNATIGAHVVSLAPEVGGRIVEVRVQENQMVKKGDLLFRIDPAPYRIALMQADAAVGTARLQIAQMEGGYSARVADTGSSRSDLILAEQNFRRQQELLAKGFTTRANFDAAQSALTAAQAKVASDQAEARSARAMLATNGAGMHPQVEAALAAREQAALNLKRTEVRAPMAGRIAQTSRLEVGATALQSLPMVSLVGADAPWIEANFKETQLARIRPGQSAEIEIDAIPGKTYRAVVTGIGSGTGSEFSVLPAQNATGNWVKVTQRVPVRLTLSDTPDRPLVAGWSAHVTVRVAR